MTRIELAATAGTATAHLLGEASAPPVLMLHDGLGLRPAMLEIAERLAAAGYRVLLPDLFYRLGPYTAPDPRALFGDPAVGAAWAKRHEASGTTAEAMLGDLPAFLDALGAAPCAITGYCMGGRLALVAAARHPERVSVVAAYHPGRLVTDDDDSPHRELGRIRARVYIGAASDDPTLTDAQRQTVADALAGGGVDHTVELYPARHGWVPSDIPVHDAAATERHWQTLLGALGAG
jgi:carboxymethylenebutenolidase